MNGSELTPDIVGRLAELLRDALGRFAQWGIHVAGTRLWSAANVLDEIGAAGVFPSDPGLLRRVAYAVRDAEEITRISDALRQEPRGELRRDLERALQGELGGLSRATRTAIQHQTQLYVGSLYAHGRWSLRAPRKLEGPTPDYEGHIGTLLYAVEVKRPQTGLRPDRIISDAARQVRSDRFHGAVVVVDITDCLPNEGVLIVAGEEISPDVGLAEFMAISASIENEIFDEDRRKLEPRREKIFTTITLARLFAWDASDPKRLISTRRARPAFYWQRRRYTLRYHRAHELFALMERGMLEAGHFPIRRHELRTGGT